MTWPVHRGHDDYQACPKRHYWPHLGDTAEHNWTGQVAEEEDPVSAQTEEQPEQVADTGGTYAKVIADSISQDGHRVTTFEVRFHRFVLAEFNTHRVFSRNSASSRAIPLRKQIERLMTPGGIAMPVAWPAEQSGMQGGESLSDYAVQQAQHDWRMAAVDAAKYASSLQGLGHEADERLHKSLPNRLLEPFMWHTVVVTATEWDNFFEQRCSPLAQPEIRVAAEMMRAVYRASSPNLLSEHEWHLPYVEDEDRNEAIRRYGSDMHSVLPKVSAARCARVSYLTQDGRRDLAEDLLLYNRLVSAKPWHGSPLEHVATPWPANAKRERATFPDVHGDWQEIIRVAPRFGNLVGWRQLRLEVEATTSVHTPVYHDIDEDI